ncbi:MAG: phage terminase large subunit family protein [Planctomycetales bacterium]|nr:phage terminase large subunit family protein [Planctomycetales bacterium]
MLAWMRRNLQTADKRPYDHWLSPHVGAPGGPCEAYLDPRVREIYLQWASRSSKTTFSLGALVYKSDVQPSPMFVCSAEKPKVEEIVGERAADMIQLCGRFPGQVKARGRRPRRRIRLARNEWRSGYARNPTTLADISAKFVLCNEVDKWAHPKQATEGDPLDLAMERAKEWPDAKIIVESTPSIEGHSRIESGFLTGWRCYYYVPCPKCVRYQKLIFGDGTPGGIVFDKAAGDRLSADLAARTARYVCSTPTCKAEIGDEHRPLMMRRGVWVPFGCDVDHDAAAGLFEGLAQGGTHHDRPEGDPRGPYKWDGWENASWIRGEPLQNNDRASYQLSTLYSLQVGWGRIAKEFVEAKLKPSKFQNLVNSWFGETYRVTRKKEPWASIAERLRGKAEECVVPEGFSLLVCGIDKQKSDFVYLVAAVGRPYQWAIVDYGTAESLEQIRDNVLMRPYDHADGGPKVYITRAFIDTGFKPVEDDGDEIYKFARETSRKAQTLRQPLFVKACKGASKQLPGVWQRSILGPNTNSPGSELFFVCSYHTQPVVDAMLYKNKPEDRGGLQLFKVDNDAEHEFLIEQLMNDQETEALDRNNNTKLTWNKIDPEIPNDWRDCLRYAIAACTHQVRRGEIPLRETTKSDEQEPRRPEPARGGTGAGGGFSRTPDGREFCVISRR